MTEIKWLSTKIKFSEAAILSSRRADSSISCLGDDCARNRTRIIEKLVYH